MCSFGAHVGDPVEWDTLKRFSGFVLWPLLCPGTRSLRVTTSRLNVLWVSVCVRWGSSQPFSGKVEVVCGQIGNRKCRDKEAGFEDLGEAPVVRETRESGRLGSDQAGFGASEDTDLFLGTDCSGCNVGRVCKAKVEANKKDAVCIKTRRLKQAS